MKIINSYRFATDLNIYEYFKKCGNNVHKNIKTNLKIYMIWYCDNCNSIYSMNEINTSVFK
jgi:hypothetical protein